MPLAWEVYQEFPGATGGAEQLLRSLAALFLSRWGSAAHAFWFKWMRRLSSSMGTVDITIGMQVPLSMLIEELMPCRPPFSCSIVDAHGPGWPTDAPASEWTTCSLWMRIQLQST